LDPRPDEEELPPAEAEPVALPDDDPDPEAVAFEMALETEELSEDSMLDKTEEADLDSLTPTAEKRVVEPMVEVVTALEPEVTVVTIAEVVNGVLEAPDEAPLPVALPEPEVAVAETDPPETPDAAPRAETAASWLALEQIETPQERTEE